MHLSNAPHSQVLEMLAYFTFYAPSISERIWTLWPQLHAALMEWGIDYWESILVPLDNMISRDTARFLTSKNPDYQLSVYQARGWWCRNKEGRGRLWSHMPRFPICYTCEQRGVTWHHALPAGKMAGCHPFAIPPIALL